MITLKCVSVSVCMSYCLFEGFFCSAYWILHEVWEHLFSAAATLYCRVHSAPPTFISLPQDKTTSVGKKVELKCQAVGNPMPVVFWTKETGQVNELCYVWHFLFLFIFYFINVVLWWIQLLKSWQIAIISTPRKMNCINSNMLQFHACLDSAVFISRSRALIRIRRWYSGDQFTARRGLGDLCL